MPQNCVLVTGGAGYIGSHAVWALLDAGYPVVVIDDLSTGDPFALPPNVPLIKGNVGNAALVAQTIRQHRIRAVIHFAGSIVVPESVRDPLIYYQNNTINSHFLIQACLQSGADIFIFSSTAAVYGIPKATPISERSPLLPINPYGRSKLMVEHMLRDAGLAYGMKYACLRYFNVAGADLAGRAGQSSPIATHLIKVASQVALGFKAKLSIFGRDYPTPDGTCIRDYIHVSDLALAHVGALSYLENSGRPFIANCGYGKGYSVLEIIKAMEEVIGRRLPVEWSKRRAGDPPALIADAGLLRKLTNWTPRLMDLHTIISSALKWERHLHKGAA